MLSLSIIESTISLQFVLLDDAMNSLFAITIECFDRRTDINDKNKQQQQLQSRFQYIT